MFLLQTSIVGTILRIASRALRDLVDILHWHLIRKWNYPLLKSHTVCSAEPLLVSNSVEAWHEAIQVPYSTEHIALLERLWNASSCVGEDDAFSVKHVKWKDIGFQNEYPASDFRGGGLLSLACLVYMAETYPDVYRELVLKTRGVRSEYEYPFAATYIHMVFSLLDALQLRNLHDKSRSSDGFLRAAVMTDHDSLQEVFQEISVHTMVVLDDVWVSLSASYVDFQKVKEIVLGHVERIVSKRWFEDPSTILSEYYNEKYVMF
jgi:hypothetical protein